MLFHVQSIYFITMTLKWKIHYLISFLVKQLLSTVLVVVFMCAEDVMHRLKFIIFNISTTLINFFFFFISVPLCQHNRDILTVTGNKEHGCKN